jgi:carboxymethylenebutenolidase
MFDQHTKSLLPDVELSRRQFVLTSLAAGFALAAQPISAQTIVTDTAGGRHCLSGLSGAA